MNNGIIKRVTCQFDSKYNTSVFVFVSVFQFLISKKGSISSIDGTVVSGFITSV